MMEYFKGYGHNSWSMLGHLIDNVMLDIALTPMTKSLLSGWEYKRMEALEEEGELEAGKPRQLELLLEEEFIKSQWSGDASLRNREASVKVTNH